MVVLLVVTLLLIAVHFWPVRVHLRLAENDQGLVVQTEVRLPPARVGGRVNVTDVAAEGIRHIAKRWSVTGEPISVPLQKTIRRMPVSEMLTACRRPLHYLASRTRCTLLAVAAEVGTADAMESALLAGASWAAIGGAVGWFTQYVRMQPSAIHVDVRPRYGAPALKVRADCILHLRLGHAMVAGVWLVRRSMREREIALWIRDSRRRKGDEGVERTSDPGIDEDGHGEPEGHGRRQHRGG